MSGRNSHEESTKLATEREALRHRDKWSVDAPHEELKHVVGRAFAGTADHCPEEIHRHLLKGLGVPTFDRQPSRDKAYTFVMSLPLLILEASNAVMYGHRETKGQLSSVLVFDRFDPSEGNNRSLPLLLRQVAIELHCFVRAYLSSVWSIPEPFQLYRQSLWTLLDRMHTVGKQLEECHFRFGPATPHYYVYFVAVDPTFQGTGRGSELLQELHEIADIHAMDCYLECAGGRSRDFYARHGYVVVGTVSLQDATDHGDPVGCESVGEHCVETVYGMV